MAMPTKKGWLAILFIITCLAVPFGITYYVSTDAFKNKYEQWQGPMPQAPENASIYKSRILNQEVMLVKGERIRVENTSLIYEGLDKDQVKLSLFLEELDPAHPYVQTFPRQIKKDEVLRFGDVAYTVKSVRKNTLILKIHQRLGTRR